MLYECNCMCWLDVDDYENNAIFCSCRMNACASNTKIIWVYKFTYYNSFVVKTPLNHFFFKFKLSKYKCILEILIKFTIIFVFYVYYYTHMEQCNIITLSNAYKCIYIYILNSWWWANEPNDSKSLDGWCNF